MTPSMQAVDEKKDTDTLRAKAQLLRVVSLLLLAVPLLVRERVLDVRDLLRYQCRLELLSSLADDDGGAAPGLRLRELLTQCLHLCQQPCQLRLGVLERALADVQGTQ